MLKVLIRFPKYRIKLQLVLKGSWLLKCFSTLKSLTKDIENLLMS